MRILIIHSYGMGDMIMFTPSLKQLIEKYPGATIDILVFQKMASEPIKYCNNVHTIYYSDLNIINILHIIRKLRRNCYDMSIFTSGTNTLKAGLFSFFVNVKERIGEYRKYPSLFYTKNIKYQEKLHRVENNILLVSGDITNIQLPLFCIDNTVKMNNTMNTNDVFIIGIHPGSNVKFKERRWSKDYFITLINLLKQEYKCEILLFGGPDEIDEARYIEKYTEVSLISGRSLQDVASLISQCDLFINTDSGLGHIASCFDIETFTIFGPAKEYKTRPYSDKAHIVKLNLDCQPCYGTNRVKSCKDYKCLNELFPENVFSQIVKKSKVLYNV